eukprot:278766-Lingulodinium_polyedra.AAC.1
MVSPKTTLRRHSEVYFQFHNWLASSLDCMGLSYEELDRKLVGYIEELWHEGGPKSLATYSVGVVELPVPSARRHLQWGWRVLKVWSNWLCE